VPLLEEAVDSRRDAKGFWGRVPTLVRRRACTVRANSSSTSLALHVCMCAGGGGEGRKEREKSLAQEVNTRQAVDVLCGRGGRSGYKSKSSSRQAGHVRHHTHGMQVSEVPLGPHASGTTLEDGPTPWPPPGFLLPPTAVVLRLRYRTTRSTRPAMAATPRMAPRVAAVATTGMGPDPRSLLPAPTTPTAGGAPPVRVGVVEGEPIGVVAAVEAAREGDGSGVRVPDNEGLLGGLRVEDTGDDCVAVGDSDGEPVAVALKLTLAERLSVGDAVCVGLLLGDSEVDGVWDADVDAETDGDGDGDADGKVEKRNRSCREVVSKYTSAG
jgi:hypothetical protein